ncbi:2'-5' RNA ligase family protein [Knoellia aerolata]|uniref:2'-5' RNA ligase n=1 Tax=Knoellia aerolata DSM 18566 TaxID=1385519 RepID=A0A0A0JWS9_9MICO|nr:2'-5' RNA ligase family protein [Knoellia aerolata]KGN41164.1 2'-5' RNA ligase [Knoellia aerolata DSM 18566]
MALAVCALFDSAGERLIRGLWARLEAAGIGSLASHTHGHHYPHLSYAVLLEWDLDRVRDALDRLPDGRRFPASVQGAVVFPRGRVALAVAVPAQVALRQHRVTSAVEATGAQLHKHYRPTSWVPHVSVVTHASAARLPVAVTTIFDVLPVTLTVAGAALIDTATGEIWPLPGIP